MWRPPSSSVSYRARRSTNSVTSSPVGHSVAGESRSRPRLGNGRTLGVPVRVAYLRGEISEAEMQTAMVALEEVGCDRVVVDSAPRHRPESRAALDSFIRRMQPGDDLVVTRLDQLAATTPRLLELLADLIEHGISVETLAGEIDTGQPETARTIRALWQFEQRAREGRRPL